MPDHASRYRLGDKAVWRVGYGAMQLAGDGVYGPPRDRDEAIAVLRAAVDAGVDHIDTAQYYGPGWSTNSSGRRSTPTPTTWRW